MPNESTHAKLGISRLLPNLTSLSLTASGLIILIWISWLTYYDTTSWSKDLASIFFGSRTGETISLGIGMKVIYYFLIGLALLLSGLITFLRRRSLSKNAPILQNLTGKLARVRGKLLAGLTLMTIVGVSLYASPLRNNTVAVVGVFASLSAVIIAFLAAVDIEIITVEEEKAGMSETSLEETYAHKIVNDAAKHLDFSYANMHLTKTNEFKMDIYSSANQITLSSHYAPTRAHPVKLQPKKKQTKP